MDEQALLRRVRADDHEAFKILFDGFYASLCHYASRFLNNDVQAEEVVQELFVKIWEMRKTLVIGTSFQRYLFRSVRNKCLNLIRQDKVKKLHADKIRETLLTEDSDDDFYLTPEMAIQIEETITSLPEKRRMIFRLNREDGLKYREIAEQLGISVKTVEAQMGMALKALRDKFRTFLFFFI
jgi:RNA polymerase sigma-70 factor (ECF subfamily)